MLCKAMGPPTTSTDVRDTRHAVLLDGLS